MKRALDAACRAALAAEALAWLGTPYHHHARLKGVGVDCAQLLVAVYEAAGVIDPLDPGLYPTDWHLHRSDERFVGWLVHAGAREVAAPALGDIALYRYGRCWSHGAVCVECSGEPSFVHAYLRRGVVLTRAREEPLAGRAVSYWSLA